MASLVLAGDTSGSITVSAPAVAGPSTQTLVATTGTLAPVVSGTTITLTNQTAPDFTSIPNWVKRITVMFNGVSTNSTGIPLIQLGASGGYETTGYAASATILTSVVISASYTTGFGLVQQNAAADTLNGAVVLTLLNPSANTWTASGNFGYAASRTGTSVMAGSKSLSGTLDRVRLFIDGTQQFDAGTINILFE